MWRDRLNSVVLWSRVSSIKGGIRLSGLASCPSWYFDDVDRSKEKLIFVIISLRFNDGSELLIVCLLDPTASSLIRRHCGSRNLASADQEGAKRK